MNLTEERISLAKGIGAAFAITFWQVIKDEPPKNFSAEKFVEKHKNEVREKLYLYYIEWPTGEELEKLQDIAEEAFKNESKKLIV